MGTKQSKSVPPRTQDSPRQHPDDNRMSQSGRYETQPHHTGSSTHARATPAAHSHTNHEQRTQAPQQLAAPVPLHQLHPPHTPSGRSRNSKSDLLHSAGDIARGSRIIHGDIREAYVFSSKVLGTGFSGPVQMAVDKVTGRKVAVKPFPKKGVKPDKIDLLKNEAEIYLQLDHPNIARLLEIYEDDSHVFMVMECCSGRELYHRLCEQTTYTEQDAANVTREMLEAVHYLHTHNVVHRDLKLENWLYETPSQQSHLKLIDFGFSKLWNPHKSRKMHATCGSIAYVSPDTLKGDGYTNACDMWSLGVIVYMLLVGYAPFWGTDDEVLEKIQRGAYSVEGARWNKVSRQAKEFVKQLLENDPSKRLTARQALEHPWIANRTHQSSEEVIIDRDVLTGMRKFAQSTRFRRAALTMMAYSLSSEQIKGMRELFLAFDATHEGTIKLHELAKVMKENFEISNEEIETIFEAMDHDHDMEICYTDFLAAMLQTRIRFHEDLIRRAFLRFDLDHTGLISVDNLREVLGETFEGARVEELMQEVDVRQCGYVDYEQFLAAVQGVSISNYAIKKGTSGVNGSSARCTSPECGKASAVNTMIDRAMELCPSRNEMTARMAQSKASPAYVPAPRPPQEHNPPPFVRNDLPAAAQNTHTYAHTHTQAQPNGGDKGAGDAHTHTYTQPRKMSLSSPAVNVTVAR